MMSWYSTVDMVHERSIRVSAIVKYSVVRVNLNKVFVFESVESYSAAVASELVGPDRSPSQSVCAFEP